ncbi:hypothetical protein [Candidatus Vampirococcus lugosii]|uniref:Uncharacterized protein n=1 Tax=Candidatus Vampirococcus lugosii TaxID=2789015 RepID=A0ABS5QLA4_9BACT|nr:hypothetical protein [Candidatus Vampirococcus lugosii]MBS8121985.1 hypothetical protein [Candidatus Vampirococcus lugosii]
MGNCKRGRYNHVLQNLNRQRSKSGSKYSKSVDSYINLLKREKNEGETKWIVDAKKRSINKLNKYGISMDYVKGVAEKRNLKDLF